MKQLLSSFGECYVVGLDKTALFFSSRTNVVSHLELPTSKETSSSVDKKVKTQPSAVGDLDEIQAVQLMQENIGSGNFWCAVSRGDKSIAIYKLNENENRPGVEFSIMYNAPKRCPHLCFADLSGSSENGSEPRKLCLIAGDLAGDAYAYSLTEKRSKLLLGHTASMLTGVKVLGNYILTADRDEKIRVSRFPETYVVEGYLLGHSAYLSSIDAVTTDKGVKLVATCGGDCTLRLWTLEPIKPLSKMEVGICNDNSEARLIPSKIALHPEGIMVAVIYDQSKRLEIYSVESGDAGEPKMGKLLHEIECVAQPLCAVFQNSEKLLTLLKDPDYIAAYTVSEKKILPDKESTKELRNATQSHTIVMPETILERDNYGNIKLEKLNETRGPSGDDAPWNRIERVDIARERQKRHKKRKVEKAIALKKERTALD